MYDELVKRLRNRANGSYEEKCDGCEFTEDFPPCVHCTIKAFNDAADAIEELQAAVEGYESSTDMAFVEKDGETVIEFKPKWIPVTERLPEEFVVVLCYCSRNDQYGCGEWVKEDNGNIYWSGLNGMIPTHWMPLPSTEGLDET